MPLSLYTKVIQQMQHFCIKNVACNDTLGAKRYRLTVNYPLSTIHYPLSTAIWIIQVPLALHPGLLEREYREEFLL